MELLLLLLLLMVRGMRLDIGSHTTDGVDWLAGGTLVEDGGVGVTRVVFLVYLSNAGQRRGLVVGGMRGMPWLLLLLLPVVIAVLVGVDL